MKAQRSTVVSYAVAGLLLVGAIVMGVMEARTAKLVENGAMAPDFDLEKFGGGRITLKEFRGQVVMVDFWATWCGPCVREMPWLTKVAADYTAKGVKFVAVNRDDINEQKVAVAVFVKDRFPQLGQYTAFGDYMVGESYMIEALPTLYIISRDGHILHSDRGMTNEGDVRDLLDQALAQKSP